MADPIAQLRHDLQKRLREIDRELADIQGLLDERQRIQRALDQPPFADGRTTRRAQSLRARPASKGTAPRKARTRAPRGANREAIIAIAGDRPGVTATEIAQATTISRPVVAATASKLANQGLLTKESLPGGQVGYRIADNST
jgi:DNA-binding transcriptional ArsR family regulator